jgi:hypothetical protein
MLQGIELRTGRQSVKHNAVHRNVATPQCVVSTYTEFLNPEDRVQSQGSLRLTCQTDGQKGKKTGASSQI